MWRFAFVSVLLSVIACEAILRLFASVSPFVEYQLSPPWSRNVRPDPVLGRRMSPYYPGHDSRGYRNPLAVDRSEVLAIGDSQTYGFGAPAEGSWPRHLERLTGKSVYHAGVGGYGPCEYAVVLDELSGLKPKVVVIGLYVGNDIANAYSAVYVEGRCQHLRSGDRDVLERLKRADEEGTLQDIARRLGDDSVTAPEPSFIRRSALYGLGRSLLYQVSVKQGSPFREGLDDSFQASASRPFRIAFASPEFRTVFRNPDLDALAVNGEDPRIREGLRITESVLLSIQRRMQEQGVVLVVAILHNKPNVMSDVIAKYRSDFSGSFFRLVDLETKMTQEVAAFLEENHFVQVDTLPALRAIFERSAMPYPASDDHHPNSTGYKAIAESLHPILADLLSSRTSQVLPHAA